MNATFSVEELLNDAQAVQPPAKFATFEDLANAEFPEPLWVVEGILPVGLTILAGQPKKGKSWLALELAQAVACGGYFLSRKATMSKVLYVALEDPPRRLQDRIQKQGWTREARLNATPFFVQDFRAQFGGNNGAKLFAAFVENSEFGLIVVDTLSRAFGVKDWNDLAQVTAALAPIQEVAAQAGKAVVFIDHHRKPMGFVEDAITDIFGSVAKGAVADCLWGFYREQGKPGAKLVIEGRDVEQQALELRFDAITGCWQETATGQTLTETQQKTLEAIRRFEGGATLAELVNATGRNKGTINRELAILQERGLVIKDSTRWKTSDEEVKQP